MSKIVQAVNVMVSHPDQISDARVGTTTSELFFLYANKHKWSINQTENRTLFLHYYPTELSLEQLAQIHDWEGFSEMVTYSSREIGTTEAQASFQELYRIVKERLFGMDKILEEIISEDDIPF